MASQELLDWIYHGREERNIEYKPSLNWSDSKVQARLTKAILALSNIRDGGVLVLGVEDSGANPVGMKPTDAQSFDLDHVLAYVNEYADPYTELSLQRVEHEGKIFIVIQVREFATVPIVCKKDGKYENIRKGAIYTRSPRMPESSEVRSELEMREILDIAVEKGIRQFLSRVGRVGLNIGIGTQEPTDSTLFDQELDGL